MQAAVPFACFLSLIRPPGVQFENSLLQIVPVDKSKCPFVRDHTDISFQLFTRHNPTVYEELRIGDDEKLFASSIDLNDQTVLYFHAFMEQPDDGSGIMIREAYMQRGDANVIMVDAHQLEAGPWYPTAAQNTWYIGNFAAQFIDYLVTRGLDLKKTHLIGHSLGAQSAGVAGAALKSGRVSRITGLDPALPLFDGLSQEQRLDSTDADFVDVIHTDAGIFGVKEPLGHIDFYPNGGQSPQPGCELRAVLPEQLLLNTCDGNTQTRGFYTFSLQPDNIQDTFTEHQIPMHYTRETNHIQNNMDNNKISVDKTKFIRAIKEADARTKYIKDNTKAYKNVDLSNDLKSLKQISKLKTEFTYNVATLPLPVLREQTQEYQDLNEKSNKQTPTLLKEYTNINEAKEFDNFNMNNEIEPRYKFNNNIKSHNYYVLQESTINEIQKKSKVIDDFKIHNDITSQIMTNEDTKIRPNDINTVNYNPTEAIVKNERDTIKANYNLKKDSKSKSHVTKRDRRSLSLFNSDDNLLFRMLNFLKRNRKNILPVLTVMREINTLVKSGNGELYHMIKESNDYIGAIPSLSPITYNLQFGSESKLKAFVKKLLGLSSNGDRLSLTSSRR